MAMQSRDRAAALTWHGAAEADGASQVGSIASNSTGRAGEAAEPRGMGSKGSCRARLTTPAISFPEVAEKVAAGTEGSTARANVGMVTTCPQAPNLRSRSTPHPTSKVT